jgi:nicotinamide-nucleotide amidase
MILESDVVNRQQDILFYAMQLADILIRDGLTLTVAESCTGGGIAYTLTELPGSSSWFDRAYITYSNQAKIEMLGVCPDALLQSGAVSAVVAGQMAEGACICSGTDVALSVTGIAGPGGGTVLKPVGLVYAGYKIKDQPVRVSEYRFFGDRQSIRQQTICQVLKESVTYL